MTRRSTPMRLAPSFFILICFACQAAPGSGQPALIDALPQTEREISATENSRSATGVTPTDPALTPQPTPKRDTEKPYSTTDRPDDVDGYQIHFIYALPSDGKDSFLDVDGEIELSANAMNGWLQSHSDHHLRFDTYDGNLDISFMQLEYTADEISTLGTDILTLMEYEIKTRGFDTSHKLFVVHYDGFFVSSEGFCGLAQYPPDGAGSRQC